MRDTEWGILNAGMVKRIPTIKVLRHVVDSNEIPARGCETSLQALYKYRGSIKIRIQKRREHLWQKFLFGRKQT